MRDIGCGAAEQMLNRFIEITLVMFMPTFLLNMLGKIATKERIPAWT